MENHYLQSIIVLVLICFFVGSIAHPQPITEQILPEIFPYTQTANISFDNMNNIHLMSLSTQIITTYPYDDRGLNILSYTKIENDSIVHITAIPDTGTFFNWGLGGHQDIFKHSIKPYRDSILLGWSKQQYNWSDVYPYDSFSKPRLHFVSIIAGIIQPLFDVDNAQAPNIVAASNGVLHFIWETDTAKNKYSYDYYKGAITHQLQWSDKSYSPKSIIGIGFEPRCSMSKDDTLHVVWLHADSSNSEYFQLQYTKGFDTTFLSPVFIYDSLSLFWYFLPSYNYDIKVDNNNIVHIGFHSRGYLKDSVYVARIYPDGRVQIYSTPGRDAKFYFTDNGDEYIVCPISGTQVGLTFYSSKWGELFTQKKNFYSLSYPNNFQLIATSKDIPCLLVNFGDTLGYIKDLEHSNDSVIILKTPAYMLGGSSMGIDSKNTIWCIYSKTPPRPLSYMYADFDTVWLLKFIDPTLEDRETVFLPNKFLLSQNYPNPFNPSTTIQYDILTGMHVTLKVYDVLGREVVTLVDRFETAGYKSVTLDAAGLPSGVYFYRIFMNSEMKTFVDVKKMVIVR